ncbi:hypothetical protein EJ04DRAFT_268953 [Polyplosphaeria fusca]|uniref:Uncharacterized protein n=1 Tax=Polyplosphaeria fusca TaxID=682080 RepID=A0A9P4V1Z4_9PLEO|nr:hypothetical protein EJ04DRAFT_268953 [Polyplosphaeria fusca]
MSSSPTRCKLLPLALLPRSFQGRSDSPLPGRWRHRPSPAVDPPMRSSAMWLDCDLMDRVERALDHHDEIPLSTRHSLLIHIWSFISASPSSCPHMPTAPLYSISVLEDSRSRGRSNGPGRPGRDAKAEKHKTGSIGTKACVNES